MESPRHSPDQELVATIQLKQTEIKNLETQRLYKEALIKQAQRQLELLDDKRAHERYELRKTIGTHAIVVETIKERIETLKDEITNLSHGPSK